MIKHEFALELAINQINVDPIKILFHFYIAILCISYKQNGSPSLSSLFFFFSIRLTETIKDKSKSFFLF